MLSDDETNYDRYCCYHVVGEDVNSGSVLVDDILCFSVIDHLLLASASVAGQQELF